MRLRSTAVLAITAGSAAAVDSVPSTGSDASSTFQELYGRSDGCGQAPPYDPSNPNDTLYVDVEIDGVKRGCAPPRPRLLSFGPRLIFWQKRQIGR